MQGMKLRILRGPVLDIWALRNLATTANGSLQLTIDFVDDPINNHNLSYRSGMVGILFSTFKSLLSVWLIDSIMVRPYGKYLYISVLINLKEQILFHWRNFGRYRMMYSVDIEIF